VGGTPGPSDVPAPDCAPGIPATSQIRRLLNRQYDAVVRDLLGVTGLAGAQNGPPSALLYPDHDGATTAEAWRLYQEVAEEIAAKVMAGPERSKFITCDPAAAGCLTDTIRSFGRKAFRRPLTDAEVARFEKLGQTEPPGTPEEVALVTLVGFLISPSFLQIPELGSEVEGDAIKLTQYEVATRLSLLIWDSIPDDVLNAAADSGELATKAQILAQAERMIQVREKAAPVVTAAHRSWLSVGDGSSLWRKGRHDPSLFPLYTDAAERAFAVELDRFFEEVAYEDGTFADLFLSDVGFVNRDTAAIYELDPEEYDAEPSLSRLDPEQRPGLFTRGAFLSSFSRYTGTSITQRGAFITVKVLGVDPGPPSPDEISTPEPQGVFLTEREVVEALTSAPSCRGCHAILDGPGIVLENYDAIGKWQTVDRRGGPIDPTASVSLGLDEVKTITSSRELMEELSRSSRARSIYAQKWVSFATGRQPNPHDACVVEELHGRLTEDGYTILQLLGDLTQTESFRLRVREQP
jgi:hypothetical protein